MYDSLKERLIQRESEFKQLESELLDVKEQLYERNVTCDKLTDQLC